MDLTDDLKIPKPDYCVHLLSRAANYNTSYPALDNQEDSQARIAPRPISSLPKEYPPSTIPDQDIETAGPRGVTELRVWHALLPWMTGRAQLIAKYMPIIGTVPLFTHPAEVH